MAEYRLHCFAQSGNSYKVALALELAAADWEPVWVDFFRGAHRAPEFVALNSMGEVPVLEHEGRVMSQSGIILDYLTDPLGRFRASDLREAWRWILWDNHKLTANLATWRFLANFLPAEKRNPEVIDFLKGRATVALKVLDRHLDGRNWIVGEEISTADLSCCGYMFYPEDYDFDWDIVPNVTAWRDRIAALPRWKHPHDVMPGHPLETPDER